MPARNETVLLTGATGFVGRHLYPELLAAGYRVRCASRNPKAAAQAFPDREWTLFDTEQPHTAPEALAGCSRCVYLIHGMADPGDYEERELRAAEMFRKAAEQCGLERIVYLGGMAPVGEPSRHLRSRLATGAALRAGSVPCIELRAAMIIGEGSESWRIVRDLSVRLPVMLWPRWLESRSQPIAIEDVVAAIRHALAAPAEVSGAFDLPGPEILSARDLLVRVARLCGTHPHGVGLPFVTPRLSSYWIKLVTRANYRIAQQLVEGLRSNLIAADDGYWRLFPEHQRLSFDEAATRGLRAEDRHVSLPARMVEALIHGVSPKGERPR